MLLLRNAKFENNHAVVGNVSIPFQELIMVHNDYVRASRFFQVSSIGKIHGVWFEFSYLESMISEHIESFMEVNPEQNAEA